MKRLLLPGLMAVAIHSALLGWRFPDRPPVLPSAQNLTVTINLSALPPPDRGSEALKPLPPVAARPIAPLSAKALPAPRPRPAPSPAPGPALEHRPSPPPQADSQQPQGEILSKKQPEQPPPDVPAAGATAGREVAPQTGIRSAMEENTAARPGPAPETSMATMPRPLPGHNPAPVYPALARRRGCQGTVILDILVGRDGDVRQVRLKRSSGYPMLDDSAREAVRDWRYEPARRGSAAVEMWIEQPFIFSLTGP